MTLFEDREQAFERLFVHREELRFRASARRNRRLAEWAAQRMKTPAEDVRAYAEFIVRLGAYFGDDGVRTRILHDLEKAGSPVSEHRIRRIMSEWLSQCLPEAAHTASASPLAAAGTRSAA